jgi:hypothetical protein
VAFGLLVFAAPARAAKGTAAPAPEPALPAPPAVLTVAPEPGGALWRVRIENKGESPLRVVADPRLLVFELTPAANATAESAAGTKAAKGAKAAGTTATGPLRCSLPADTRPSSETGKELVVPPGRSWSAKFDPLFYCFGARERGALVSGTTVQAHFGWPVAASTAKSTKKPSPPFAVTPLGAGAETFAAAKSLDAAPFTLTESVTVDGSKTPSTAEESGVTLSLPPSLDAARGVDLGVTVTLANRTDRPITLLFRPNMFEFTVTGPQGMVRCGEPRTVASPIRELFSTVPVKGTTQASVLLTATCPSGTFDEPGIYRVTPRLDTTNASGKAIGLHTWDGVVSGKTPLLLRIRSARGPELSRPTLD